MSDLTEKWKKGKLKEGCYYVRNEQGVIFTAENYVNYDCFNDTKIYDFYNVETDIKEILAPVPSYEEWKSVCNDCNSMQETIFSQDSIYCENENLLEEIEKIDEENQKLKDLLKECRDILNMAGYVFAKIEDVEKARNLLNKIDEVSK